MHHIVPRSLTKTLEDISHARLSSYRSFFNPPCDEALYGLYCWNETLSACLMRLIGVLEISLRNKFHVALSTRMWTPGVSVGIQSSNDWYNHVRLSGKSEAQVQKITHRIVRRGQPPVPRTPAPSPNQVVASLTYGFWPRLLDLSHDKSGKPIDWGQLLLQVVPYHQQRTPSHWKRQAHQDSIYARLDMVGGLRNRVAHFEPIWKLKDLKEEKRERPGVTVGAELPAPQTVEEAIERLGLLFRRTSQLLFWLSKDRAVDFAESETNHIAKYLLTKDALNRYQRMSPAKNARLSSVSKSWGMKLVLRDNTPIIVYDKLLAIGRYYPYLRP